MTEQLFKPRTETREKLINLGIASLEVHKTSASDDEARKGFRTLLEEAYKLGYAEKHHEVTGDHGKVERPVATNAKPVEAPKAEPAETKVDAKAKAAEAAKKL